MQHLEEVMQLRQQGHRLTPQRLEVLKTVREHGGHLTVEEIHETVLAQQPFMNVVTVYRIMQWLQAIGMVASITGADGLLRYEYRQPHDYHHHLICQQCGQEIQIAEDVFAAVRADVQKRYGFAAQLEHVAIEGMCASCQTQPVRIP